MSNHKFPPLPGNDDTLTAMNLTLTFRAPRTLWGWLGMRLLYTAKWFGVEPHIEASDVTSGRFGDIPTAVRDALVADMLTAPPSGSANTIITRKLPPTP